MSDFVSLVACGSVSVLGGRTRPIGPLRIKLLMAKLLLACWAQTGNVAKKNNATSRAAETRFEPRFEKTLIGFLFSNIFLKLNQYLPVKALSAILRRTSSSHKFGRCLHGRGLGRCTSYFPRCSRRGSTALPYSQNPSNRDSRVTYTGRR